MKSASLGCSAFGRILPPRRRRITRHGRECPTRSARHRSLHTHRRRRQRRRNVLGRLHAEQLEQRRLLAFDFVAAYAESPIPFFVAGDTTATPRLAEAPQQVTLRFSPGIQIDPASIGGGIQFVRSFDGMLGDGNDVSVMPTSPIGSVTVGDVPNENEIVIRFAETLPDDLYRFTVTNGLRTTGGDTATTFQFDVRLDLGSFVTAVVPQPVERAPGGLVQQRDQVHVYFNAGDALNQASAQTPGHYRLVPVSSTGIDGSPVTPISVAYTAASARAVLTFAPGAIADGMTYRLEAGPTLVPAVPASFAFTTAAADDNSGFASATPLGILGANGITATARIDDRPVMQTPAGQLSLPNQPGTIDEPGHRDVPADSGAHGLPNLATSPSRPSWVLVRPDDGPVGYYNFRSDYGRDPAGNLLFNTITEAQKQRTREVFESFSRVTGIRFVEEVRAPYIGLTVATGDIRAVDPNATPGPGGIIGIAGAARVGTGLFSRTVPTVVMDSNENWGESEYGGGWFETAMHEIGHALRLRHSYDLPSILGAGLAGEKVFPGDYDTIHLRQLFPTTGTDIDVYSFTVNERGKLSAETVAGRPGSTVTSLLDSVLTLYREDVAGGTTTRTLVARNDDYYGRDSFVGLDLEPGRYFLAVTSTGNDHFNPEVADSGYGGRTRGPYELRLGFTPAPSTGSTIVDTRGTPLDGDRDGLPGGTHAFWFRTASAADTVVVDKLGPVAGADGTLARPFPTIAAALSAVNTANAAVAGSKKIVRIVGNDTNTPYLVGLTSANQPLADGSTFNVPKGVTVMIDAGAVFKLRSAIIDVGSSQPLATSSRAEAALQVLGVPGRAVTFTSYHDDSIGGNSDGSGPTAAGGQWGGLVFRRDSDASSKRAFVNTVQQGEFRFGGGQVRVDSQVQSFAPIQIESTRPSIAFNTITGSAGAAIAATPNSFEDSNGRIGPEIRGNRLVNNTTNGLFIKILTRPGAPLEQLDVPARFKSTDIVYVLQENLVISGGAGGYALDVGTGRFASRSTGRLAIDPGGVVKLQNSRIELERGASQLIAEGNEFNPVVFTSLGDNRYGAGGTFDTNGNIPDVRAAGDWGGIILNAGTRASIDQAYIAFGGGLTPIEGTSDSFNVVEVHQGDLRLTNTRIENNLSGLAVSDRTGRGSNAAATVFVRGAQPIILGNDFRANAGAAISANTNSLSDVHRPDSGRSTGSVARFSQFDDNVGPLLADNRFTYAVVPLFDPTQRVDPTKPNLIANGSFEDISTLPEPSGFTTDYTFDFGSPTSMTPEDTWSVVRSARDVHSLWADYRAKQGSYYFVANGSQDTTDVVWQMANVGDVYGGLEYQFEAYVSSAFSDAPAQLSFQLSTDDGRTWRTLAVAGLTTADGVGNWKGIYARWTPPTDASARVRLVNANSAVLGNDFGLDSLYFGPAYLGTVNPPPRPRPVISTVAGLHVRAEEITAEGVWDDASIVHVVQDEIVVNNLHTVTGLRLQSKPDASLVVKFYGDNAGITAAGYGLDIDDRIGGTVQIVGHAGRPVVLTSIFDDSVGAGTDALGNAVKDTSSDGASVPSAPGDWRSLKFLPLSNDRNVSVYIEAERPLTAGVETNALVENAEDLGVLAPNFPTGANTWESAQEKSGDENRRLGFEVHGLISPDDPTDVDVYTFQGYAGSEVWIDVDKTATSLDAMVELLDSFGNVLARSVDEGVESRATSAISFDLAGGLSVLYSLPNTNLEQGTLVGTLFDGVTGLAIQDFSIAPDGSATFYDRLPNSAFHATGAVLDPATGELTLGFDAIAGATRVSVSYAYSTGSLSGATLGAAQVTRRDGWRGGDFYTTNPRDPGMRLVLPGSTGEYLRYYVRVRSQPQQRDNAGAMLTTTQYESRLQSSTFDQPGDPAAGVTSGHYELRVRLRQRDEKPGSVVRYADIRHATVGIDVQGLPRNSLLAGETGESTATNDTRPGAQYVGNLLESDRNTISIAGTLASSTDVDWYEFALNYEQIQGSSRPPAWSTVFDLDYADGFRGDLTLAVFDAAGTLLYVGHDSDIRDDQPGVGQGNDFDDLSRGTLGKLDPFIGSVQLPTDNPKGSRASPADPADQLKYYVAVMSNGQLPSQLNATFQTAAGNTLVRLEPVTSIRRVVEDHIGFTGFTSHGVGVNPTTPLPLVDISSTTTLSTHVRPFTLADVTLFVSSSTGLFTVDAATGARETTLVTGITGITLGDLDMRTDGRLYAYAGVNNDTENVGRLIEIDSGTGAFLSQDNDEIENVDATTPLNFQTTSNTVTALAFRRTDVADYDELWFVVQDGADSKLYRAEDGGSATTDADAQADQAESASTTRGYRGRIAGTVVTGLQFRTDSGAPQNGDVFGVTSDGQFVSIAAGAKVPDDTPDFPATFNQLASFTTQLQAVNATGFRGLAAAPRNLEGGRFAGMFVAVTNNGRLCVIDPATNQLVRLTDWGPGTPTNPGELFSPAITGVTGITGLAFSPLDINLWHPTERRGDTDRDTVDTPDPGHGINVAPDNTRNPGDANRRTSIVDAGVPPTTLDSRTHTEAQGGISMYFGLEQYQPTGTSAYLLTGTGRGQYGANPTWHEDLTTNPAISNNYNLPGGAYGSLITNPFSLAGYASTDKPTLYFNYWLETQEAESKTSFMRDSARVLVSVDQGLSWQLLATNNSTRSASNSTDAELPTVISASSSIAPLITNQHVQELFDSASWRQARVDLGKWAGRADVRLRFDFHTAGEFDPLQVDAAGNRINTISGLANTTGNFGSPERGQNNRFEGFYIDDIIVGFAERGEMVTEAAAGSTDVFAVNAPPGAPAQSLQGPYQLEIRRGTEYSLATTGASPNTSANMAIDRAFDTNERLVPAGYTATGALRGDSNLPREQGQFVIDGNVIANAATYGISIDAGVRDAVSNTPHPGVARNLPTLNNGQLVPGAFVVNNIVSGSGTAGIRFSGDATTASAPAAVVPFGRIVNNTIYGGSVATGVGIEVTDNAGPTLMNNLFANLATGVSVDTSSQRDGAGNERTVVTHSGFSGVTTPVTGVTDRFRVTLPASPFLNAAGGNFYPVAGSPVIDTSLNSLQDRNEFVVVNSPIGVPPAPILAPEKDLYGQVRWDDPGQTPSLPGLGLNAFKDLGAIDRVDFSQSPPSLAILDPQDNAPIDIDRDADEVEIRGPAARSRRSFAFQIFDPGAGIDQATVVSAAFTVTRDGVPLVAGKDYVFRFLESSNRVVFEAASTYRPGIYKIVADRTVVDRAGNPLRPNNLTTGATEFEIRLLDVPYAPAWPGPMSPLAPVSPLLAGWHENQTIHLGWSPAFTVLPSLPILDYDVEMSTDNLLTPGLVVTPAGSTTATALTLPGLVNGSQYWFRVRATNGLGAGPWSDVIGPIVPQPKPSIALALDTGASDTDGITQNGLVNVTGVAAGARWQYRHGGMAAWTDGVGASFVLPEGVYPVSDVQVRQIVNGYPSVPAVNAGQWTIDSTAPPQPSIKTVLDDAPLVTGPVSDGGFTNDTQPTFEFNGPPDSEPGSILLITVNAVPHATITVPAGSPWSYTFTPLIDGPYTFGFTAQDVAGNLSATTTFSLNVDTINPTPPVAITDVNDDQSPITGTVVLGGTTNDTTPTFAGIAEPNARLRVTVDGGTPTILTVPSSGTWTYTSPMLADGPHTFSFVAVDDAGNENPPAAFSLTVDTIAPATPVITSVTDNVSPVTGPITAGGFTNDPTPTFTGTAEPNSTVRVTINGGAPVDITVPLSGAWAYTPSSLPNGPYTFAFIVVDGAGNQSQASMFSLTVDRDSPNPPVITSITDNVSPVTGSISDGGFTNDTTPTFSGTAEPNASLRITVNAGSATVIAVSSGGAWSYTPPMLPVGTHTFSFVTIDSSGNESSAVSRSLTVDTVAPLITGVQATSPSGTYGIGQTVDIEITFDEPVTVSGVPQLQLNTTPLRSATYLSGSGTSVLVFRYEIQIGDRTTRLDYASAVALGGGSIPDRAGNVSSLTLPAPGAFLGRNIVIDAVIKATVAGFSQSPADPPDFASPVTVIPIQFNTPVTNLTLSSLSLQRLSNPADPTSGRPVSLAGASISGSGTNWTLTLPSSTNPTSLPGRYKLVIGGVGSGIQAGGAFMDISSEWYFDRI